MLQNLRYFASAGIHPWYINDKRYNNYDRLIELLKLPRVIAIGECGLDRNRGALFATQLMHLEHQLALAEKLQKPVILHAVRSYADLIPLKKRYRVTAIVHGFNGNLYEAQTLVKHGFRLSFGHRMLREGKSASILKWMPAEHLYLETDNYPLSIQQCYEFATRVRGEDFFQLQRNIARNFERDFSVVLPT